MDRLGGRFRIGVFSLWLGRTRQEALEHLEAISHDGQSAAGVRRRFMRVARKGGERSKQGSIRHSRNDSIHRGEARKGVRRLEVCMRALSEEKKI